MPVSRKNEQRGCEYHRQYRGPGRAGQRRSRTRAKLKVKIGQRCAEALRLAPGTVFINGKFQRPFKYGYAVTPSGQFRMRIRYLAGTKVQILGTGQLAEIDPSTDRIIVFINPEK